MDFRFFRIGPGLLALALAVPAGCSTARPAATVYSAAEPMVTMEAADAAVQVFRQVVRRGDMEVEVERLEEARARLERALAALGGRVALLQSVQEERASYGLRVPADRLDPLMDSVAALGRVQARTVTATEVTERVVDWEARLAALRASRDRLRQLLERATTVQDVITVERELARVQGEVESLEGRLNALRSEIADSELSVRLERRRVLGPLGVLVQGIATVIAKLFVWR